MFQLLHQSSAGSCMDLHSKPPAAILAHSALTLVRCSLATRVARIAKRSDGSHGQAGSQLQLCAFLTIRRPKAMKGPSPTASKHERPKRHMRKDNTLTTSHISGQQLFTVTPRLPSRRRPSSQCVPPPRPQTPPCSNGTRAPS